MRKEGGKGKGLILWHNVCNFSLSHPLTVSQYDSFYIIVTQSDCKTDFLQPVFFIFYSTLCWYPSVRYVFFHSYSAVCRAGWPQGWWRGRQVSPCLQLWSETFSVVFTEKMPSCRGVNTQLCRQRATNFTHTFDLYQTDNKHCMYCVTQHNVQVYTHQRHIIHKKGHTQATPQPQHTHT